MSHHWISGRLLLAGLALLHAATAAAGDFPRFFNGLSAMARAKHREPPAMACDPCTERVSGEIEWLERYLDRYGSIVAKQPDVWGQNRLTRHRYEYEEQLRRQLDTFEVRSNAALRRSDQAFLGMAMALQAASGRRRGPEFVQVPGATNTSTVFNQIDAMLPTTNEQVERPGEGVIARTAPFQMPAAAPGMQFEPAPISLEPTIQLDQLSRYLNHLHELRRINEGDDIADSPGYSLNLVRIPISVTPGKLTQKGHGAKVTMTARLILGGELLPVTFRSLVINDLVDMIAPALTWCVNDPDCVRWAALIAETTRLAEGPMELADGRVEAAVRSLAARLPTITPGTAPSVKSRRARMPIPFSQLADAAGTRQIAILIHDAHAALENHPASRPCIGYGEVRNYLAEELDAAYDFLTQEPQRPIWAELPQWNLAEAVRSRRVGEIARLRDGYFAQAGDAWQTSTAVLGWAILLESALLNERLADDLRDSASARGGYEIAGCRGPFYGPDPSPEAREAFHEYVCRRWPIRVFALDPVAQEQNVEDAFARRRELQIAAAMAFASGRMGAQGLMRFTRRLEMEMATVALNKTAVGFVHGADTFGWIFQPRVQTPPDRSTLAAFAETVCGPSDEAALMHQKLEPGLRECTAIIVMPSFVPFVALDVESEWFSLAHPADVKPSTREAMLFSRAVKSIEAGVCHCRQKAHLYRNGEFNHLMHKLTRIDRELPTQSIEAQIPHENTAGGFELFNTGITDLAPELIGWYGAPGIDPGGTTALYLIGKGLSVHDTSVIAGGKKVPIRLVSREVLVADIPPGVRTIPQACHGMVRGAIARSKTVQAAAFQAEQLPAPPEGVSEEILLEPGPADGGCDPCGDPCGLDPCGLDCNDREVVEIHLATPYGVSSRLFVPVVRGSGGGDFATTALTFAEAYRLGLTFTTTKSSETKTETAKVDEFYSSETDTIVIRVPEYFIPPPKAELACTLVDEATGAIAGTLGTTSLPFDARRGGYRLGGTELRNFIGDTSRPATDKTLRGAVKPYLDAQLAEGRLANEGDAVTLRLTAKLVAEQQEVPVDGGITIKATRRR
jgi:hypothetical protein